VAGQAAVAQPVAPVAQAVGDARPRASDAHLPVTDQVARHLTSFRTLRDGTHRTVLRLAPEHLGELTMTVDVRAGTVHLAVAGSGTAIAALRDGLGQLRDHLGEAGLDLGELSLQQDSGGSPRGQSKAFDLGGGSTGRRPDDTDRQGGGSAPRPAPRPSFPATRADGSPRSGGIDVLA
jgi:flagellar hook-length control protein FliK